MLVWATLALSMFMCLKVSLVSRSNTSYYCNIYLTHLKLSTHYIKFVSLLKVSTTKICQEQLGKGLNF